MAVLERIYKGSLSLLNDLYQLTMAYSYWASGNRDKEAVFHLFFRDAPFQGHYALACGLEYALEYIRAFCFDDEDIAYLKTLTGMDGEPLFTDAFLDYLKNLEFTCDVDAVPEGTVMFPHEPLLRVRGPLLQCQLLETPLLNIVNFQTLIATKAAHIRQAAGDDTVMDFGLRRAQGIDGGLSASRAAYVGGVDATSNVLAGKLLGIPVKGTHAHSWVMSFESEREAFDAYAQAMPHNAVLLVDTYDTLRGVRRAIQSGYELRRRGYDLGGIRLDSGDLAELAIQARRLLDDAGFHDTRIVASSDLDEYRIADIKARGGPIDVWGVGTKLATAHDDPALDGVYKLAAVRAPGGDWSYRVKLSDNPEKVTNPGVQQVRRFMRQGRYVGDMIYDENLGCQGTPRLAALAGEAEPLPLEGDLRGEDLLQPVFRNGGPVYQAPGLDELRRRGLEQVAAFRGIPRQGYAVGLEPRLRRCKDELIRKARGE